MSPASISPVASTVQSASPIEKITARSASRLLKASGLIAASFLSLGLFAPAKGDAQVNVTTYHNDIGRTGQNLNETILNTSNVNATTFGKLFSQPVDGQIYAQPLYLTGVTIGGAVHNVVYVATENDSVYAFDADSNGGANSSPLWMASMLTAAHGAASGATTIPSSVVGYDIQPQIGITGTPVIDPTTNTLYVVGKTMEGGNAVQRLHALDVTSGAEKFGGPVVLTASVPGTGNGSVNGTLTFDPLWESNRPGLLLLNGIVWIGFAAHGDNGPWHGWILGYNAATLQRTGALCATPNGTGGGFWMSGEGLPADQLDPVNKPFGRMFVPTGNGDYTATKPYTNNMDYGDSHLVIDLTNGVPTITDEFTTLQQQTLDNEDGDIASGGLMVIPPQTTGTIPNLAVQVGKGGTMYLLNRDNMGGYNTTTDQAVQEQAYSVGNVGAWSSPAWWNGTVYWWGRVDGLKSFKLTNGLLSTNPVKSTDQMGFPGATPSISANGTTGGIVWAIDSEAYGTPGPSVLSAHDATNVLNPIYQSSTNAARDAAGNAVKFAVPTVTNGKVYVGTASELDIYGLLNGATQTAAPSFSPGTESFTGTINVSISDNTSGANIYYTTNGTSPTTSSTLYSGPIPVSSTTTIKAVASATGQLLSAQASATYSNTTQASTVVFSLPTGTYTSAQSLTLTDSTAGASIYYTIDGSTPTTASTLYSGAIAINTTETVTAIAVASGVSNSPAIANTYTINSTASGISYPAGFAGSGSTILLNGNSQLNDTRLQLTDGLTGEAGTAWYVTPVNIQTFTNDFTFQLSNPGANGMTFTIQNSAKQFASLGYNGSSLGYAPMASSVAIKFDFYTTVGTGQSSTGLYVNGAAPTTPAIDMLPSGINLRSGDEMSVHMVYNGTVLTMTVTDMVTSAVWSGSWTVNIPTTVGGNTAYVGFTGSTGAYTASQKILTWGFVSSAGSSAAATPTFSPAAGTYTSAQNVTISDATSGATIYYTTDGTTPTTSSAVYSSAIAVSATKTIKAIAAVTGSSSSTTSSVASATYTITTAAATPTFSPAAGTYTTAQNVTISDATSGATIYYTTDGSTPTTSSAVYSSAIAVSATKTVKAIAAVTGSPSITTSAAASATYTITTAAATPTFSPAAGAYTTTQNVAINDATSGATIYYTTDGSTPTTSSAVYSTAIAVSSTKTIKSIAAVTGSPSVTTSAVASAAYTIGTAAATPTFSPAPGTYSATQRVLLSDTTSGATIYYTVNGTTPTTSSTVYTSSGIIVSSTQTIQALAVVTGSTSIGPSAVASGTYTIILAARPTFSPGTGSYSSPQTVAISETAPNATIYYTTNGTTPSVNSTKYTAPITVSTSETVQAVAVAPGYAQSPVGAATYTIAAQTAAATPTFSLAAGSYSGTQSVTLSDATSGASIYYTTNGTTPSASSTKYTGAISVAATETLSAIAVASGYSNSAVASATYTITSSNQTATPTFVQPPGTSSSSVNVQMGDATAGAVIYYTTNGATPTTSSSVYSGYIAVTTTTTLKAIAVAPGFTQSAVLTGTYTIAPYAAVPVISPAGGSYTSPLTVTMTDTTPGAVIHYTIDQTTPTASSPVYSGTFTLTGAAYVQAVAVASGYTTSYIASANYNVHP